MTWAWLGLRWFERWSLVDLILKTVLLIHQLHTCLRFHLLQKENNSTIQHNGTPDMKNTALYHQPFNHINYQFFPSGCLYASKEKGGKRFSCSYRKRNHFLLALLLDLQRFMSLLQHSFASTRDLHQLRTLSGLHHKLTRVLTQFDKYIWKR